VSVDENVLVAELLPGGQRIVFRGVDDEWRPVRFADGNDSIAPEITRRVGLRGWGPDSALAVLGIAKPDDVELEVVSEDLGQARPRPAIAISAPKGGDRSWPKRSRTRFTTAPRPIRPMFEG
jgi:hypothetical protein